MHRKMCEMQDQDRNETNASWVCIFTSSCFALVHFISTVIHFESEIEIALLHIISIFRGTFAV